MRTMIIEGTFRRPREGGRGLLLGTVATIPVRALLIAALLAVAGAAFGAPDLGERLKACAACHGDAGHARDAVFYPSIAGKPQAYLYNQLLNFRDGRRHHTVMTAMFSVLDDDYLRAIARYYASQPLATAPPVATAGAATLALGEHLVRFGDPDRDIPPCQSCHGTALTGTSPAIPGLLGLAPDYVRAEVSAWKSGVRHSTAPDCMARVAGALSAEQIDAASAWLASRPLPVEAAPAPAREVPLPLDCGVMP